MPKGDNLTTFVVSKVVKKPEALTFRNPKGLFRLVAGKLYFNVTEGKLGCRKFVMKFGGGLLDGNISVGHTDSWEFFH